MLKLFVDGKQVIESIDSLDMLEQSAKYLEVYGYTVISQDDTSIRLDSGVSEYKK